MIYFPKVPISLLYHHFLARQTGRETHIHCIFLPHCGYVLGPLLKFNGRVVRNNLFKLSFLLVCGFCTHILGPFPINKDD